VSRALEDACRRQQDRLTRLDAHGHPFDWSGQLARVEGDVTAAEHELAARARVAELKADPALLAQPPDRLAQERQSWRARRDAERAARRGAPQPSSPRPTRGVRPPEPVFYRLPRPGAGPGIGW
jgi:exodeoxyribonuclease V alpha subunit